MRETLDQMAFVDAAFAVAVLGTLALVWLSWQGMRRAEARRDAVRAMGREIGRDRGGAPRR